MDLGEKCESALKCTDYEGITSSFVVLEGKIKCPVSDAAAHEFTWMFFENIAELNYMNDRVSQNHRMFFKNVVTNNLTMQNSGCIINI